MQVANGSGDSLCRLVRARARMTALRFESENVEGWVVGEDHFRTWVAEVALSDRRDTPSRRVEAERGTSDYRPYWVRIRCKALSKTGKGW